MAPNVGAGHHRQEERGDSYRPLVELMGGRVIEVDLEGAETLNPWDLPPGQISPSKEKIAFLKNLTLRLIPWPGRNRREKTRARRAAGLP